MNTVSIDLDTMVILYDDDQAKPFPIYEGRLGHMPGRVRPGTYKVACLGLDSAISDVTEVDIVVDVRHVKVVIRQVHLTPVERMEVLPDDDKSH